MPTEPLTIEISEPIPGVVHLPGLTGSVKGQVKTVEIRDDGILWVQVSVEIWQRWSTQTQVGQKSVEGVGPARIDFWAPAEAVESDEDKTEELRLLIETRRLA